MDLSRYCSTDYVNKRKPKVDRDGKFLTADGLNISLEIFSVLGRVPMERLHSTCSIEPVLF